MSVDTCSIPRAPLGGGARPGPADAPAPVEFRFTRDQISAELGKAGFSLQTSHNFLPRQILLVRDGTREVDEGESLVDAMKWKPRRARRDGGRIIANDLARPGVPGPHGL